MTEVVGRAKGGIARAKALSREELSESARNAALARWGTIVPVATHTGDLPIGDLKIACAVLPDGTRLLSERAITKAFGGKRGGSHWRRKKAGDVGANLPLFLSAKNISSNISKELGDKLVAPILYRDSKSKAVAHGIEATVLPHICRELRRLSREGKLSPRQVEIANQAEAINDGLGEVGIIGLVDEATGYQAVRDKHALQEVLNHFLGAKLGEYAKRFPDEFYEQIARLRGWNWQGRKRNPPQVVGYYTTNFVYHRLAPKLVEELNRRNPVIGGRRKNPNQQWLSDDVGHPALAAHLRAIVGLMRGSKSWDAFVAVLDDSFPRLDETMNLDVFKKLPRVIDMSEEPTDPEPTLTLLDLMTAPAAIKAATGA